MLIYVYFKLPKSDQAVFQTFILTHNEHFIHQPPKFNPVVIKQSQISSTYINEISICDTSLFLKCFLSYIPIS